MRKLKLFLTLLMLISFGITQVWGAVVSGTTYSTPSESGVPTGWSAAGNGSSYLQMVSADHYIQTDEFCQNGFTSIVIKARKYNGPSATQLVITAEWIETGEAAVTLGTVSPSNTTLSNYTISSPASVTGNKSGVIKISCKGASDSKGSGVSEVTINYTAGTCAVGDPHTVSFNVGGSSASQADITEASAGAGITLPAGPTPTCYADGWTFAGWKETSAVTEQTTTAPTLLAAGTNYKPSDDVTLYAVYKKTETGDVTDQEATETFENQTAESTYNSTKNYAASASNASIAWTMYYGCVSTNDKIAGSNSAQMRWYSSATSSIPYAKTTTAISGLQSVNFKARVSSTDVKMSLWYSTDGENWTVSNVEKATFAAASTAYDFSATINGSIGTNYYIKIGEDGGKSPSSGNYKLIIDAVQFNYLSGSSTTYYLSAPSCCEKHAITIATGIENGSVEADLAEACEGTAVTLTFTPTTNYHLSGWTLNDVAQDVNANTFSMPAGAATISATFDQDACDPLATPVVTVSGKAYPYNAVKLAWSAITNADSYKVYIYDAEDNELEHNDAVTGVEYTIGHTLSASTTYKYSVQAISNTPATYCPSTEAASTFVTDALPTAHLTLIDLEGEHASSGDYAILTPFNLPTTAASCSKAFYGWTATNGYSSENEAPEYVKGAEFTFANTTGVTLYAVYADETPGAASLTKLGNGATFADGDKLVIAAKGTHFGLYFENAGSSYIKNWEFAGDDPVLSELADAKKILTLEKSGDNWKFGDATNGYFYSSGSNNLEISTTNSSEFNSFSWNNTESAFTITKTDGRYLNCRTDLTSGNANLWRFNGTNTNNGSPFLNVYKYALSASTYSNYATTCVAAPTAEPASASIAVAAAGGEGTLGVSYENVNLAGVEVALFNNEACTEAFDGGWLTASIAGDDKHIAYTVTANTTSYVARTAYIKLTAPETSAAADPAVVVIPVTQAKYIPVFADLAALVSANLSSGTDVTVSFDEVITDDHFISQGTKRAGVMLTTTAGSSNNAIEIFYNKGTTFVPAEWLIGGSLSATSMTFTWTLYNEQWELVPLGNDWTWENGDLTYTAPKEVSSVVITGAPTKTSYVDGELFKPAGLTVTVSYTVGEPEVNPVGLTFACTPERVAKSDDPVSVSVVATFNEVSSEAFNVTGLTVGDIQLKTIQEFITAGNADMRCYLEGTVSNYTNTTKGYFDLTDESATIYIYGCDAPSSFAAGDKIKVIAEDYDYYNSKHEAKNVVFVSKKAVATMTFDDMALETGDVETMAPKTITLAEASAVAYSIKEGSDNCVTIDNENKKITATAAGSATIIATLAETADYMGTTVEFDVTVTAPDTRKVANGSTFTAVNGDLTPANIKFAAYKGDGTTDPAINSNNIRIYKPASGKSTGGYLTLTALMGYKIDQVEITFSGNADAAYCVNDEALPTEKYIIGLTSLLTPTGLDAQSVTIVNLKNGSIDISAIKVWYDGEALAIHHYILGGTYETTFEQNTTFSYEGLTVTAAYDELETITEPITDFTVVADLSEVGQATASVRRNDAEIATYAITVTPGKANPNLAYTPNELELAAADVASWVAPVFSNPFEVSPITYSSNKTAVAKVTSDGVITLQGGYGTAVITASYAGDDDYIASQATYTITVNEPIDDIKGHWVATNAVQAGMEIIIANVADANGNVKTMGAQNNNNRAAVASTVNEKGVLSPASGTKIFTLVDAGSGNYNIKAVNNNYLYAASGSSNHLKEEATPDANHNADWAISFANGKATIIAQGNNARNWMRYNSDNNIFSCYASGQEDIIIYAINEEVKEGETIDASSLREDEDIVINGDASIEINQEVSLGDIHVKANKTVTIEVTEDATLGNLDLENGAILDLDITPGATVAANDLILRSNSADRNAQQGKSSQAPGVLPAINGILALEIDLRPELAADATLSTEQSEQWYCISAPFDVDINSGFEWVYPDGHRTAMTHNTDFQIFAYDGARRATGISGWKRTSGTMKAGVAHFIGFDNARTNQKVIRLTAKNNTVAPATEISLGSYPGATDVQNWNGVANPTLQYIGINKNIVAFDYGIQDYNTYAAADYNYFVGSPFFIQQDGGSIAIDYNDRNGAIHAPQREAETLAYCVRINAASANCFESQLYVRASETASYTYEEGHDMASQSSTTPKYGARIWSENYNMRLGIEEAPLTNGNASYVLGIATPAAGEYTISVAAPKENATLYLTYNGSIIWNLSNGAYTIDLPKGITSGYGLVMQAKAPQVGTDIESQTAIVNGVEKVVINNTIYILRDQQMYDLTGKMVK